MATTLYATIFTRPHARQERIVVKDVDPEDAEFFVQNNVFISMESDQMDNRIVYADYGRRTEDGEPDELIELARLRSCREVLKALRQRIEEINKND